MPPAAIRNAASSTRSWLILATTLAAISLIRPAFAQAPPDPNFERKQIFTSYQAFKDELNAISVTTDAEQRNARLDTLWNKLKAAGQIPFAVDDHYAFLYRGKAKSVAFPADHTKWQPAAATGINLPGTDLWYSEGTLPPDARVDYKIVLDGATWIEDPTNPLLVWSGFGKNSEFRMPQYVYPRETIRRTHAARGKLSENIRITSKNLGYDVQYRVYTTAGYDARQLANLPTVYVTDGHEYAADHMGSLVALLDNLIDDQSLVPAIAVFIDPRDPNNLDQNRRIDEYNMNPRFAEFVTGELVPAIDAAYRTSPRAADRVILGTSMGGLNAAYFAATKGDVFSKIGIQSPAFGFNPEIYHFFDQSPKSLRLPLTVYMTSGTLNDGNGGPTMRQILERRGDHCTHIESNQGHSWGNWRGELANMLVTLVGSPPHLKGDYNRDGAINFADFGLWSQTFGQRSVLGAGADGNGNCFIDPDDFTVWQNNFGSIDSAAPPRAANTPDDAAGCHFRPPLHLLFAASLP